jgi:hypothetical protein
MYYKTLSLQLFARFLWIFLACQFFSQHAALTQNVNSAGNNLYFNGNSNFVDTKDTIWYQQFTVECWVKSPNAPSSAQGKGPVHYEKNFQINWDHVSSNARNALLINTQNGWRAASFGPLEANTWYHLAGTYDGDTLKTYKNGELITQLVINDGPPNKEEFSLKIGKHAKLSNPLMEFFNGNVDEVRVWNVARTADDIKRFMHHPLDSIYLGLKHYYTFNDTDTDSTLNLATGLKVPKIQNPEIQDSHIPIGVGKTGIYSFGADSTTHIPSSEQGFSFMSIDSSGASGKLMVTVIEESAHRLPFNNLFKSKPYWIIKTFGNDISYKSIYCQFPKNWLEDSLLSSLNQNMSSLNLWYRSQTSASSFWNAEYGIHSTDIFNPLPDFFTFRIQPEQEGQMALSVTPYVSTSELIAKKDNVDLLGYSWANEYLTARFSLPIAEIYLQSTNGKHLASSAFDPSTTAYKVPLYKTHNIPAGIYIVHTITQAGNRKSFKIIKN